VGGDLVGDGVGPGELADELAPRAGRAYAAQHDTVTDLVADLGEPRVDHLDGAGVGRRVDLFDDLARLVHDDEVRRDRTDVDTHEHVDRTPVCRPLIGFDRVAEQQDLLHRKGFGDGELRRGQRGRFEAGDQRTLLTGSGLEQRRPDRAHREVELGHEQAPVLESERLAQRLHGALVGGDAADERDRGGDDLALGDRPPEIAHHGVAEAAEHFRRFVALLLGVDHVALREHAAASGDARRLAGPEHDVADVLDLVQQPARLLVHERPGTGGAVAVRLIVGDAAGGAGV